MSDSTGQPKWRGWGDPRHPLYRQPGGGAPTATPGNTAALKSGVWSRDPERLVVDDLPAALTFLFGTTEFDSLPGAVRATRQIAAELWARRQRAIAWVSEHGELREDGTPQPALAVIDKWETKLLRLLEQHGGTPLAQATLAEKMAQVQQHAWNLDGLAAAGRAAALEAQSPKALEPPTLEVSDDDSP